MDKKIGEGRTAEIFAFGDNRIAKVFRSHIPDTFVDEELKISEMVQSLALNVPKVYGIEKVDGHPAIVYERIEGLTLLATLVKKPWKVKELAKTMARLHYAIHSKSGEGLDTFKSKLKRHIGNVGLLKEEHKKKVVNYLDSLPESYQLCHGDFHPDNILFSSKGAVVIDWTTAVSGNPLADVARTAMILKYAALPDEIPKGIKLIFQRIRPKIYKNYLNTYMELSKAEREDIDAWELPIMAARLIEGVPEEEKDILCLKIREKLG